MTKEEIMRLGIEEARRTMRENIGGAFGAVIMKDGEVVTIASNRVLLNNDPTAHAEMVAIREACKKLGTYDLTGCELYATGYPCPMCLSAIIWSNIKKIYVSGMPKDAEAIGFRDDFIYRYIEQGRNDGEILQIEHLDRKPAQELYAEYAEMGKVVY